jgi:hypothetical protein
MALLGTTSGSYKMVGSCTVAMLLLLHSAPEEAASRTKRQATTTPREAPHGAIHCSCSSRAKQLARMGRMSTLGAGGAVQCAGLAAAEAPPCHVSDATDDRRPELWTMLSTRPIACDAPSE